MIISAEKMHCKKSFILRRMIAVWMDWGTECGESLGLPSIRQTEICSDAPSVRSTCLRLIGIV